VIQPQVLLQLPCYDFTPITNHTVNSCPPASNKVQVSSNKLRRLGARFACASRQLNGTYGVRGPDKVRLTCYWLLATCNLQGWPTGFRCNQLS